MCIRDRLDADVQDYIRNDPAFDSSMEHLRSYLGGILPRFSDEGRPRFSIATGCTGGRHRSVFAAVILKSMLEEMGYPVRLDHRDIK